MELDQYKIRDIWRIKHMIENDVRLDIEERMLITMFIEYALDLAFKEFINK